MKKVFLTILVVAFSIIVVSCGKIKEYNGKKITKLTYQTINYNGGYTQNKVLDFVSNQYLTNGFLPIDEQEPNLEFKKDFSEEEEKAFIDGCYSYGLFTLKSKYERIGIIDGQEWSLVIEYEDGTVKTSIGINSVPTSIFNKCSTYFYDLCGEQVLGSLPKYYNNPPAISYAFNYKIGENGNGSDNTLAKINVANYKWNKFEVKAINIYKLNEQASSHNQFLVNNDYQITLYTANYDCDERFNRIVITSYDYNEDLTNEQVVYSGSWFKQIKIKLELNKIYKYILEYKDGDFVEFTFNTKPSNNKILFGEYHYNIYQEGESVLKIYDNNTYELFDFDYFDTSKNSGNSIKGQYDFKIINDKEYLCLDTGNQTRIVLEFGAKTLIVNYELSTFDLKSYHIELKNDMVYFMFYE